MIRVAIVEDDPLHVKQLREYIRKYQTENDTQFHVSTYSMGEAFLNEYSANFDIILLDIQLGRMNGLDVATKIRQADSHASIVFVTSSIQYAIRGYSVNALDYIVKPVKYFKFAQVMKRAVEVNSSIDEKFTTINTKDGVYKVPLKEIYYIESRKHDLCYVTKRGEFVVRGRMADCIEALAPYGFYQVHKSYIVNIKKVEKIGANSCVVHGMEIMIGRAKKKDFMDEILSHMGDVSI